jgi:hypothetical protein
MSYYRLGLHSDVIRAYETGRDLGQAQAAEPQQPWLTPGKLLFGAALVGLGVALYKEHKFAQQSARVQHGYDSEPAIGRSLAKSGADVGLSPGSRGPVDIYAEWSSKRRWAIQAKSSRSGEPRWPGPAERHRLVDASRELDAQPVVALRRGTRTTYFDVITSERLYPARSAVEARL